MPTPPPQPVWVLGKPMELALWLFAAAATVLLWHEMYFGASNFIWAQNLHFDLEQYSPWIRQLTLEHDGVEIYALYLLAFGCLSTVLLVSALLPRALTTSTRCYVFLALALLLSITFLRTIGFVPPLEEDYGRIPWLLRVAIPTLISAISVILVVSLRGMERAWGRAAMYAAIGLGLIPLCFVTHEPISVNDYAYVLAPALRLIQGAPLQEVYLQYDLLLSLLGAAWMKLGSDPELFYVLLQASYYGFFLAAFALSRQLFYDKTLALTFLISIVMVRLYCGMAGPVVWIQVTPLRLEWWLVFLILVYIKGPYHWTVGLFGGALVFFHRNFGVIYALAYLQLLATLCWLDYLDARASRHSSERVLGRILKEHAKKIAPNVLAIVAAAGLSVVAFYGYRAGSVFLYQRIGVGFIQIPRTSFYWYAFILLALVPVVLLKSRQVLTRRYLTAGLFLTYLAIGNSIYFFGRSHEASIIHLSGALIMLFFVGLDAAGRYVSVNPGNGDPSFRRSVAAGRIAAALFVGLVATSYYGIIAVRVRAQINTMLGHEFAAPFQESKASTGADLEAVRAVTGDARKVYFLVGDGFLLYHYGHYQLSGYFNPYKTWVFKDDLLTFLQQQIDAGYYIVCDNAEFVGKELAGLRYSDAKESGRFVIISGP